MLVNLHPFMFNFVWLVTLQKHLVQHYRRETKGRKDEGVQFEMGIEFMVESLFQKKMNHYSW